MKREKKGEGREGGREGGCFQPDALSHVWPLLLMSREETINNNNNNNNNNNGNNTKERQRTQPKADDLRKIRICWTISLISIAKQSCCSQGLL